MTPFDEDMTAMPAAPREDPKVFRAHRGEPAVAAERLIIIKRS
jgi:hypothetical protein